MLMIALRVWPARRLLKVSVRRYPEAVPRVLQCRIDGSWLLVLADSDVGRQIVVLRRYEQSDSRAFDTLIPHTDRCVDVGANVGYFMMLVARSAFRGSVVALDPIPINQSLRRASVELNGYDHAHALCSAVDDHDGIVAFVEAFDSAYSSLVDTGRSKAGVRRDVPICTLDTYWASLGRTQIDVVRKSIRRGCRGTRTRRCLRVARVGFAPASHHGGVMRRRSHCIRNVGKTTGCQDGRIGLHGLDREPWWSEPLRASAIRRALQLRFIRARC